MLLTRVLPFPLLLLYLKSEFGSDLWIVVGAEAFVEIYLVMWQRLPVVRLEDEDCLRVVHQHL
jgi:hypothetical protein